MRSFVALTHVSMIWKIEHVMVKCGCIEKPHLVCFEYALYVLYTSICLSLSFAESFGQAGMVAGVYAGVEYTLEKTRGKQDWVC